VSKESWPWLPAQYDKRVAYAIKALQAGNANDVQQKEALRWIVWNACGTYDEQMYAGGDEGRRATDYALGKRHVGLEIVKMINLDPRVFKPEDKNVGRKRSR
jgi:hypothetical protein